MNQLSLFPSRLIGGNSWSCQCLIDLIILQSEKLFCSEDSTWSIFQIFLSWRNLMHIEKVSPYIFSSFIFSLTKNISFIFFDSLHIKERSPLRDLHPAYAKNNRRLHKNHYLYNYTFLSFYLLVLSWCSFLFSYQIINYNYCLRMNARKLKCTTYKTPELFALVLCSGHIPRTGKIKNAKTEFL